MERRLQRDLLCESLFATLAIQDTTADVVVSRATTIASLLSDPTQLSETGLTNCSYALLDTIGMYPDLSGESYVSVLVK